MKRKRSFRRRQAGFSLVELLIVIAIIGILATVAVPQLLKTLESGKDTAAVRTLQTIHTNQAQYIGRRHRFATLRELGEEGLLDPSYASGAAISGYRYTSSPDVSADRYCVQATRETPDTGSRDFNIDQSGIIRYVESKTPSPVPCGEGIPLSSVGAKTAAQ